MDDAIDAVEEAFRRHGHGQADNRPRQRPRLSDTILQVMPAAVAGMGLGLKAYTVGARGVRFLVLLWDEHTGDLEAVIEAGHLGQMRTGAASGVATKHLARADASTVAIFGTGTQAPRQLEAVCAVRPVERIRAHSRTPAHSVRFSDAMMERLGLPVEPVETERETVEEADIIITITKSSEPLFDGDWLRPGAHVNAAGSNRSEAQEIDTRTLERASLVTIDDRDQGRIEAGDLLAAERQDVLCWDEVLELSQVVAGCHPGRRAPEGITVFESLGVAMEDVAVARTVYEKALEAGAGEVMPETLLG